MGKFDQATANDNPAGIELDIMPVADDPLAVLIYPMIPGVGCVVWLPCLKTAGTDALRTSFAKPVRSVGPSSIASHARGRPMIHLGGDSRRNPKRNCTPVAESRDRITHPRRLDNESCPAFLRFPLARKGRFMFDVHYHTFTGRG